MYVYIYIYTYMCVYLSVMRPCKNKYSKNVHFSKVTKFFVEVDDPSHWGHVGSVTILRRFASVKTVTKLR